MLSGIIVYLDKYNQEWQIVEEKDLDTFKHERIPISYFYKGENAEKTEEIPKPRGVSFDDTIHREHLDEHIPPSPKPRTDSSLPKDNTQGHGEQSSSLSLKGSLGSGYKGFPGSEAIGKHHPEYPKNKTIKFPKMG